MLMYLSCGWRYDARHLPGRLPPPPSPPKVGGGKRVRDWGKISETKPNRTAVLGAERNNWEIFAVIHGGMALVPSGCCGDGLPDFRERTVWITPPGSSHTWATAPGTASKVLVFHFARLPELLEISLGKVRSGHVAINKRDIGVLQGVFEKLIVHYRHPEFASPLIFEAAACELSAFFLQRHETLGKADAFEPGALKVAMAVQLYRQNIQRKFSVNHLATAVGVSSGYLRKMFMRVYGKSTKEVLLDISMDHARQLLLRSEFSMKEVAVRSGFGAFSQFYRAFREHAGLTPSQWLEGQAYGAQNSLPVSSPGVRGGDK